MAGSTFSLVDIYYIPLVTRLFAVGFGERLLADRAGVRAWWQRITSRPGIQALLAADKEAAVAAAAAMAARR
jgi:glutathione S-transferase